MKYAQAVVAQSVERRLGKAEVGGSIPLDSLKKDFQENFLLKVFFCDMRNFVALS